MCEDFKKSALDALTVLDLQTPNSSFPNTPKSTYSGSDAATGEIPATNLEILASLSSLRGSIMSSATGSETRTDCLSPPQIQNYHLRTPKSATHFMKLSLEDAGAPLGSSPTANRAFLSPTSPKYISPFLGGIKQEEQQPAFFVNLVNEVLLFIISLCI